MRVLFYCLAALLLMTSACTRDEHEINGPDPVAKTLLGKWALKVVNGLEAIDLSSGSRLFDDTLIYNADMRYQVLNNNDTTDRGAFSLGRGSAVNGFGRVQIYDSIVYNSASIATDATPPPVYYFKLDHDTLSLSFGYLKDSADTGIYASYIRQ